MDVGSGDRIHGCGDGGVEGVARASGEAADELFEFGPGFLDGIVFRGVGRQIKDVGVGGANGGYGPRIFVGGEVVHHDAVSGA